MTRRNLLQLIAFLLPILRKLFEGPRTPELVEMPPIIELPWRTCPCDKCIIMRRRLLLKVLQEKGSITLNTTNRE